MGKKQHQKDKLYLTCTEWRTLYGGKKASREGKDAKFRRLPFDCCSLSMQPFEHPYCTRDGNVFDLTNIMPFLKKYGMNPVSGEKLTAKDLVKLNFHKNSTDKYHCPVTFRIFNENTHIVAVSTTGNVFSYEAVEELNIKPSHWKDLLTDEPFIRKDLITIQDPSDLEKFNLANFYHLKKNLKTDDSSLKRDSRFHLKTVSAEVRDALDELDRDYKAPEKKAKVDIKADHVNAASYSTGRVAASFTSTAMVPETRHEAAIIDEDILRYERVKKKAYVQVITNLGNLNIELHSDAVPRTCENFLKHCKSGYYDNTTFHRSIRNFMIQGGDPAGTGSGGDSIWGKPFQDEMKPNLTHTGRGILSMANSGPNTNKSQFFITYRSARHLDGKHSVFGRIVGGIETLDKMEKIKTDKNDKPTEEIRFLGCQVFVDPYDEADQQLKREREAAIFEEEAEKKKASQPIHVKETKPRVYKSGVGKYINLAVQKRDISAEIGIEQQPAKQKRQFKMELSDFSAW